MPRVRGGRARRRRTRAADDGAARPADRLVGCEFTTYRAFDRRRRFVSAYLPCSNEKAMGLALDPQDLRTAVVDLGGDGSLVAARKVLVRQASGRSSCVSASACATRMNSYRLLHRIPSSAIFFERGARLQVSRQRSGSRRARPRPALAAKAGNGVETPWRRTAARRKSAECSRLDADRRAIVVYEPQGAADRPRDWGSATAALSRGSARRTAASHSSSRSGLHCASGRPVLPSAGTARSGRSRLRATR